VCVYVVLFAGLAESTDLVHWQKVIGPLEGGAVMGPSSDAANDTSTAFDSLCIGVGDVRINTATNQFEMLYFGGSNLGTQG
jgi:hypothetical protein